MESIEPSLQKRPPSKADLAFFRVGFFVLGVAGTFMLEMLRSMSLVFCVAFPVAAIYGATGQNHLLTMVASFLLVGIQAVAFAILHYLYLMTFSRMAKTWQARAGRCLFAGALLPVGALIALQSFSIFGRPGSYLGYFMITLVGVFCLVGQFLAMRRLNKAESEGSLPLALFPPIKIFKTGQSMGENTVPLLAIEKNLDEICNAASLADMNSLASASLKSAGVTIKIPRQATEPVPILIDELIKNKKFAEADVLSKRHMSLVESEPLS